MSASTTPSPRHTDSGTIAATPPFAFAHALRFLDGFTPTHGEQTIAPDTLTKAVFVAGRPLLFRVRSSGTIDAPALAYTLHADDPLDAHLAHAAGERIAFFLGTADDLRPFYAIGRADADFAPLIERLYGYHQVTFLTPFENACWAVLSQRTPQAQARRVKEELTQRYGATLALDGVTYPAFPDADRLAAADPDALLAIVRNERRASYLRAVAAAFVDADESWLRTAPYDEVEGWLRAIEGIGAWSATFIMLRGLGRMERHPAAEARLGEAVSRVYLGGQPVSAGEIARRAAPYGPWRGYWAHYLRVAG